jgi:hypothetical protein
MDWLLGKFDNAEAGRRGGFCLPVFPRLFAVLVAVLVVLLPAGNAAAQSRGGFVIFVAPPTGGLPEEQEFFYQNMTMELLGANYGVTEIMEEADYTLSIILGDTVNEEDPSEPLYNITMVLTDNRNGNEMIRLGWDYRYREEMYQWNLYLIYQAMANLPIMNRDPEAFGETGFLWEKKLYLGLRAGFLANFFSVRKTMNYEAGQSQAFGFEAALVVEGRPFRLFGFQGEAVFAVDAFNAGTQKTLDNQYVYSSNSFTSFSLMFPLLIKLPLNIGKFILSFYGGVYCVLTLGMEGGESQNMKMAPPVGLIMGADLGFRAGPGEFFMDLRYGADLGATGTGNEGVSYTRQRGGISVGYKIGLWNRTKKNKAAETVPEEAAVNGETGNEETGNGEG